MIRNLKTGTILILICLLFLSGCKFETPEIRGVVLDAETKQPVEGAWVGSTLTVRTKTVAGDKISYLSVEPPHTRTDKSGRFVIPPKKFKKPPFPFGFGTNIESFGINAATIDDRSGGKTLKDYELKRIEITIYVKQWEKANDESEYFSYIRSLSDYCLTGRFGVEIPSVEGGCDDWELGYAIAKHERFINRIGEPDSKSDRGGYYTGTLNQLGYLLKKRGNYRESLDTFKKLKEFSKKRKTESLYSYEFNILMPELDQLLKEKPQ